MSKLVDSFWRAAVYCVHPRVLALSLLPLVVLGAASAVLGYFFWDGAVAAIRHGLEGYQLVGTLNRWLVDAGLQSLQTVLAPALLLLLAVPIVVIVCLLIVAVFITPSMVSLVAKRRFALLERRHGGSFISSLLWSLSSSLLAVVAMLASIPLWLIPPLILVLPPLIWGWLTYRVMSYDALAEHASPAERQQILRENRGALLGIGVLSGYLGAAPSLIWASGALFVVMAPVLVPLAIWVYTMVFAFSSLWFAHFTLAALAQLREKESVALLQQSAIAAPNVAGAATASGVGVLP